MSVGPHRQAPLYHPDDPRNPHGLPRAPRGTRKLPGRKCVHCRGPYRPTAPNQKQCAGCRVLGQAERDAARGNMLPHLDAMRQQFVARAERWGAA